MPKFLRLIVLLILASSMLLAAVYAAEEPTQAFSDITGHWAETNIRTMEEQGVLRERIPGFFMPNEPITRAEFVDMLVKSYLLHAVPQHSFTDISYHWAKDSIATAHALGLVLGESETKFAPDKSMTREQMVTLLMRAAEVEQDGASIHFDDEDSISAWAKAAVSAATQLNLIHGYPSGEFAPQKTTSRAEAVVVLQNTVNLFPYTSYNSATYDTAETYGPSEGQATVGGRVLLKASNITLQNTLIHGDLIIDKAVGEGQITLRNVTVLGNTYVQGGGTNSLYLVDCQMGMVYVQKDDKPVRIVVSGSSEIQKMLAESSAIFEEVDLTGTGIYGIIATRKENATIFLQLKGIHLERLDIHTEGVEIITDQDTLIKNFYTDAATTVQGLGVIEFAQINASGVLLNNQPTEISVSEGVEDPSYPPPPVVEEEVYLTYLTSLESFTATPQVGVPLSAGAYLPSDASVIYQWWICNEADGDFLPITGATSATYTPVVTEEGMYLKVSVSGYGNYAGYVISNPSTPVAAADTSSSDTAAILAAKALLETEPGSIFLEREIDVYVAEKAQLLLSENESTRGVTVTYSPTNTNVKFTSAGEVLDFESFDLGSVELFLSQGMANPLTVALSVIQDDLLRAGEQRYPTGTSMAQRSLIYGGNQIVSVGSEGALLRSNDGIHWTNVQTLSRSHFFDVIWSGNQFVAVGSEGAIYTSGDGITWYKNNSFTTETLNSVCWNGSMLLVVGNRGTVLTAKGGNIGFGESWYKKSNTITTNLFAVTWFNNLFVAVGENGMVYTSPDGIAWTERNSGTTQRLKQVVGHAGMLVAVGDAGTILYSENGVDWSQQPSGTQKTLRDVIWADNRFVAVGFHENPGVIIASTDGKIWTILVDQVSNGFFTGMVWTGKELIIVGYNTLQTSLDGITWKDLTDYELPREERVYVPYMLAATYGGARYFSGGTSVVTEYYEDFDGTPYVYTSNQGYVKASITLKDWFSSTKNSDIYSRSVYDLTNNGSKIIAVGHKGEIFSSVYGDIWVSEDFASTNNTSDPNLDLYAVCWNGQQFLAVGEKGAIRSSADGTVWTQQASGVTVNLRDVLWNGAHYVVIGDLGTMITSTDGVTWQIQTTGVTEHLESVSWNGNIWVAVGGTYPTKAVLLYSTDGEHWTAVYPPKAKWFKTICWNGQQFMAAGLGYVYTSQDGVTWTNKGSSSYAISDLIWDGNRYVAVTWTGGLLTSSDGVRWIRVS